LVPIAGDLGAGPAQVAWLIAGLYLASAVAQPTMGRIADLIGPRRVYVGALFLVALAGVLGGLAPDLGVLIAARVLLGIGTSGAYPSAMRLFRHRAEELGAKPPRMAMAVLSLAALSTTALGPPLGGLLTEFFGWHSIFTINLPLAAATMLLVLRWVPSDGPRRHGWRDLAREIDPLGLGLFALALVALLLFLLKPLSMGPWALPAALVAGAVFFLHARRAPKPFINVRMLADNRPLSISYMRAGAVMMIAYCIIYGFAQWLERGAGFTAAQAGLVMLPVSLTSTMSALIGARARGIRGPFIAGIAAALVGSLCLLLFVRSDASIWIIVGVGMLFGPAQGLVSTATQAAIYVQAPAAEMGAAAGLQRTAQYIGAIAATSLLAAAYGRHPTDHGLHSLAAAMAALAFVLLVSTVADPTIPRGKIG
jgi:MFS family permease